MPRACRVMARDWLIQESFHARGGRLAGTEKNGPVSAGTFPTHSPLFVGLVVGVIAITGDIESSRASREG
jgi:K+-transporting ATPase A subunit